MYGYICSANNEPFSQRFKYSKTFSLGALLPYYSIMNL
jgi:hypothetical protein